VIGTLVGSLLAAGLVAALKMTVFDGDAGVVVAYLSAAVAGVVTGLFAGKPIWASGAQVEAGLKAFFGALIALGAMFALRRWAGGWSLDLSAYGPLGRGHVGDLPAASLPLIGALLGALFELDNTGSSETAAKPTAGSTSARDARKRIASAKPEASARLLSEKDGEASAEVDATSRRSKR
jgi:hypothetical protein